MLELDIRTLIFNQMLFTLVFALGLYLVQLNQPTMRGLRWWAGANAIGGVGLLLTVLRGLIPDFVSILIANGLLLVALGFFHTGVAQMRARPALRYWVLPLLLAVMLPILAWYTYVTPSVGARIVTVVLINAVPGLLIVRLLVDKVPQRLRASHWFTAAAFAQYICVAFARMVHSLIYPLEDLMSGGTMQTLSFMSLFILLVVSSFGCVWMVTAYLADALERQARTDALTGILNRFALDEGFARELERARRSRRPLSVLLFDLDHFKQLNDSHGHQLGDSALQTVARLTQHELRASDLQARYGGEEFLVVLPDTDKQSAIETAERLRRSIEHQAISCGEDAILTASYGVCTFPEDGDDVDGLVGCADKMLYVAKQTGRNRVVASGSQRERELATLH